MIKIIILSLIMVQLIQYSIIQTSENKINKSEIERILYIITPLLISMLYMKHSLNEEFLRYSMLVCFLIVISIIDYYTMYIYDITIISGIIIQGIILLITKDNLDSHILGLLIGFIIPYIMVKLTKGVGSGDVGVYALCCFCIGIERSLEMIIISFVIGAIYALYMMAVKRQSPKSYIPFAPCIFLATMIVILTQQNIMHII
ncbi:MAG: prepilin peptidase [Peptostreptococcaceae bacterium]